MLHFRQSLSLVRCWTLSDLHPLPRHPSQLLTTSNIYPTRLRTGGTSSGGGLYYDTEGYAACRTLEGSGHTTFSQTYGSSERKHYQHASKTTPARGRYGPSPPPLVVPDYPRFSTAPSMPSPSWSVSLDGNQATDQTNHGWTSTSPCARASMLADYSLGRGTSTNPPGSSQSESTNDATHASQSSSASSSSYRSSGTRSRAPSDSYHTQKSDASIVDVLSITMPLPSSNTPDPEYMVAPDPNASFVDNPVAHFRIGTEESAHTRQYAMNSPGKGRAVSLIPTTIERPQPAPLYATPLPENKSNSKSASLILLLWSKLFLAIERDIKLAYESTITGITYKRIIDFLPAPFDMRPSTPRHHVFVCNVCLETIFVTEFSRDKSVMQHINCDKHHWADRCVKVSTLIVLVAEQYNSGIQIFTHFASRIVARCDRHKEPDEIILLRAQEILKLASAPTSYAKVGWPGLVIVSGQSENTGGTTCKPANVEFVDFDLADKIGRWNIVYQDAVRMTASSD